jgi:tetratricopeptide (TPR) repeat protein
MLFEDMPFGPYDEAEQMARQAYELYEDGQISQSLQELEAALEINPSNSAWHFNKALALDALNYFEDAINEYETALELNPYDLEILNSLAVDYTRAGQYDLAIETFERIEKLDSAFEPSYCNRIIAYTEMGKHEAAEQMFYVAQQIDPDCPLCYYNIGNSLFIRGEYKKAIHCWLKTKRFELNHPQINYRIAQAYWADGDFDKTREHFLIELRLNPGDVDVILDFGLFLLEIDDIESAKEKFHRIIELKPDFAPALFYLGEIAFNKDNLEKAQELFNQALLIDSTICGPRYRLAQCALRDGQKVQAKACLLSELSMAPEDPDILVSMGSIFLIIQDFDYAAHCLLRALEFDYSNADAYYFLGIASAMRGQFTEASEFFTHALDIRSDDIKILKESAQLSLTTGNLSLAEKRVAAAVKLTEKDSDIIAMSRKIRVAKAIRCTADFISQFIPLFILKRRNR